MIEVSEFIYYPIVVLAVIGSWKCGEWVGKLLHKLFAKSKENENNTQNITPITNPQGEARSGKIDKDFTEGQLVDNTTGSETRRGSNDAVSQEGVKNG